MSLLPVHDALTAITDALTPVASEYIDIATAASGDVMGRVLAEHVTAQLNHPPQHVSAMDGYAIRHADLNVQTFTIIGESAAGHPFNSTVGRGEAVRIFTGGFCPEACDTIVIQENAHQDGNTLTINEKPEQGAFIRTKGNDFVSGDILAKAGEVLTPRLLSLMAAAGVSGLSLRRRPLVAIISTGDELVPPGQHPKDGQIISSNDVFLAHYLKHLGADIQDIGIIPDHEETLKTAFNEATDADLIITSGGASVGQHDGVAHIMQAEETTSLNFWRIAMRPGKPLIFGKIQHTPMLGLPGNPVSTGVCAMIFAATAIKALTGQDLSNNWGMPLRQGRLTCSLKANDKRQDYMRAKLSYEVDGIPLLTPYDKQDSGMLKLFTDADALIIRPPFAEASENGDCITFMPITTGL